MQMESAREDARMSDTVGVDLRSAGWHKVKSPMAFLATIGPLWSRREDASWAYAIAADERHLNGLGVIHGGLITSFVDTVLAMLVWERIGHRPTATVQLNTQFIDTVREGELVEARGEVIRAARSLVFVRCLVTVGDRSVALADGVWKVLGQPAHAPPAP